MTNRHLGLEMSAGRPRAGSTVDQSPRAPCRRQEVEINRLNPHLLCMLCGGYYVDATTIIECLHSFCKTCIVRYLETSNYCPQCDVQVHKTRPLLNIRPDHILQDLVYKLVPGLFTNEMRKRREFYTKNPPGLQSGPVASTSKAHHALEERLDLAKLYAEEEKISLSLEFSPDGKPVDAKKAESKEYKDGTYPSKRYLLCPAAVKLAHLKKFIRYKLNVPPQYKVDIFHTEEPLGDPFTLMDIAYIYSWRRRYPLKLFYCIYQKKVNEIKRKKPVEEEKKVMEITEKMEEQPVEKEEKTIEKEKQQVDKEKESVAETEDSSPEPEAGPSAAKKPRIIEVEYSDISSDDTFFSQLESGSKSCPEETDRAESPKIEKSEKVSKEMTALITEGPVTVAVTISSEPTKKKKVPTATLR